MLGAVRRVRWSLAILIALIPALAAAQGNKRTTLTTSGFPLSASTTTTTDFDAGATTIVGNTTITVDLTTNSGGGGFSPRVTTVNVRCNTPCPATGTAAATLQWRLLPGATWVPLTTTFTTVDSRTATYNGTDDPWSGTMAWRYALTWTGNPPAAASAFYIQFELVVTAP